MRIRMLVSRYGVEDGFIVRLFEQNSEYDIAESLACAFVRAGDAAWVTPRCLSLIEESVL